VHPPKVAAARQLAVFLPDMPAHGESHIDSAHTHMETRWYLSYEYDSVCPDLLRPGMGRVFSICSGDKK